MNAKVDGYIDGVLSGRIVTGRLVRMCVERHVRDLESGSKRGLVFDPVAAQEPIEFIETFCRHSKGEWAGTPLLLEPWQQFRLASIFGWKIAETGLRRFQVGYTEVARKNGKSTEMAGVGNHCLIGDAEPGAEVVTAATKLDQAKIVHSEAIRMVKKSPDLQELAKVRNNRIFVEETDSTFVPLGRDSDTQDGLNISTGICDEVHAWPDGEMWDVLETATGARRQPLLLPITTAGFDRTSLCYWMHEHTIKCLEQDGYDDRWFGYIAALDEKDEWRDESCWIKPNPNLGVSVKLDVLRALAKRAEENLDRRNAFQQKRLNIWTQQLRRWLNIDQWLACPATPIDIEALHGRLAFAGLDMSATTDLTACVFDIPLDDGRHVWWPLFWIPEDTAAQRMKDDRIPYLQWQKEGFIRFTEGNVVDYDQVRSDVIAEAERFQLVELAYDRWNATQIGTQFQNAGVTIVPFIQGFKSYAPATKEFERLLAGRRLLHGHHPILTSHAQSIAVKRNENEDKKPDKPHSTGRIDGIVAGLMALGRAILALSQPRSRYEDGGLRTIKLG